MSCNCRAWCRSEAGIGRRQMQVAGIRKVGAKVDLIEMGEPRPLAGDEVLVEVRAAGVANWDELVRTGCWDVGATPPMALGVQAAGCQMGGRGCVPGTGADGGTSSRRRA